MTVANWVIFIQLASNARKAAFIFYLNGSGFFSNMYVERPVSFLKISVFWFNREDKWHFAITFTWWQRNNKGPSMYYVIKIWGFLTPPPFPFVITFSTERNQKLPFSDPPSPLCDYVIHGCSLILCRRNHMYFRILKILNQNNKEQR